MSSVKSWFSPKVKIKNSSIEGKGLHCIEPISKDEIIAIKGGHIMDTANFEMLPDACKRAALQIAEHMYVAPMTEAEIPEVMNYINHSCSPNVGLRGQLLTVAMRDIDAGEELTGDYCVAYSNDFFHVECRCGTENCRKVITSSDWQKPELQARYKGYFCQYIDDKISQAY